MAMKSVEVATRKDGKITPKGKILVNSRYSPMGTATNSVREDAERLFRKTEDISNSVGANVDRRILTLA